MVVIVFVWINASVKSSTTGEISRNYNPRLCKAGGILQTSNY